MKRQNKSLDKITFFSKVKSWCYNVFNKPKNIDEKTVGAQNISVEASEKAKPTNSLDEYRKKNERYQYLLRLQNKFENNVVLESDISESDKKDLEELYIEQINELKRKIVNIENKIKKLN